MTTAGGVYLKTYLAPFAPWLEDETVTDILVNRPGEVWIERQGAAMTATSAPEVTDERLLRLAQQAAAASAQGVNRASPLLAATLPGGARLQIAAPPATRGGVALAIRKHVVNDLTLDRLHTDGAFDGTKRVDVGAPKRLEADLPSMLASAGPAAMLATAVKTGRTVVVSGGTGAGKTTLLNALLKEIPAEERVLVIEDTPEVRIDRPNAVGLVAVKGDLGEAQVGVHALLEASLRMRPDRLLMGEIRGAEAFAFLRAVNTGHAGSLTTVHADSPRGALDQIAFMAMQAGVNLARAEVIDYAREVIDVIVQVARVDGRRRVTQVAFTRESPGFGD